ncbi:hypothetical protein BLNAU_24790 [Blattamonas nauphoetae]|uniref:Uncharacterized protein n=1 Tax=Blattamonas nauphoetae TaxID=2049346 RepID=A0ABQ9WM91_9EUKA|nr:hypothetical protein BLNAU_24790 [Blattamonas nauphoetae]
MQINVSPITATTSLPEFIEDTLLTKPANEHKMGSLQVVHLAHILIQSQSEFSRIWEAFARMGSGEDAGDGGGRRDREAGEREPSGCEVGEPVCGKLDDPSFGESSEEERQELMLEIQEDDEPLRKIQEKREKEQEGEEKDEMQRSESELESELWESSSEEGFEEVVLNLVNHFESCHLTSNPYKRT